MNTETYYVENHKGAFVWVSKIRLGLFQDLGLKRATVSVKVHEANCVTV